MVVLGSTTAAAAKIAVAELPVTLVPAVRFGMAGLCLLPWVLGRGVLVRMIREDALLLLVTAALCVPINQGFFLSAARLGPTSHVGIFYATCPLVVLLLAWTMRMERPDRGRLWGVLASVAGIVVIGIGNYWTGGGRDHGGGARRRARRSVAGGRGLVVGRLYRGEQAAGRAAWSHAGRWPRPFLVGCLLSLPAAVWAWPGFSSFGQVSSSAWLALADLGALHHAAGLGLSKPVAAPVRREPGRHFQQRIAFSHRRLGGLALWRVADARARVGGALTLGGIYWASRARQPAFKTGAFRLEHASREGGTLGERHPVATGLALNQEAAVP